MNGMKIGLAAGLALVMILAAGAVWSQASGTPTMIYACYHTTNGILRIVSPTTPCKPNEVKISWNRTGPQGPPGDPGPAGPPGESPDRYVDLGDGTIFDRHTGLVWLKDADCAFLSPKNWNEAKQQAALLESGLCGLSDGSWAGDWRLPTKTEWMATIAEAKAMGCVDPVLTDMTGRSCYSGGAPWALNLRISGCGYWTSTPHFSQPDVAPYVHLSQGNFGPGAIENECFNAWPVRKGPEGKIE